MTTDPVTLQLIGSSLLYASEEMGLALRNSAYSPNIKERMDHSAALFDPEGRLLAQAEHIPVHLGSLPWGLANLLRTCRREGFGFEEGTMVASNDPYITGTHLNDVTVMAPIHHRGELVAFAVNKAHHSDVGGSVPGSISPTAKTLSEEGFILEPVRIWNGRRFAERAVETFALASRTPAERRGDLRAQVAANITGSRRVLSVIDKYGRDEFRKAATHSFRHSQSLLLARLSRFKAGSYSASDTLEGPTGERLEIDVRVRLSTEGVDIDYTGTSAQVDYPLNAVLGVTISGAYFTVRCLTGADIPANHGAFSRVRVTAAPGTIVNPTRPHPVGGGNVETSQRNADVLFRALAPATAGLVPAAAGGSMNNVMVGGLTRGRHWAFYETIGVGLGGSRSSDGVDGIQANMTNTMNTPIEEMERAFPIRLVRYEFRPFSGGPGMHRGGCGLTRSYMALSDATTFTVFADREKESPWGLSGGLPGSRTEVTLFRGGRASRVPSKSSMVLRVGDVVEVKTAGGGGYGNPRERREEARRDDVMDGLVRPSAARPKAHRRKSMGA